MHVEVLERDMLEVAGEFAARRKKVAVLSMANDVKPGGGYASGRGAQEENLHRRTDAVRFTVQQKNEYYPIPDDSSLLAKGVTVFRGKEQDGYPFLDSQFTIDMISCAAVRRPCLTEDCRYRRDQLRNVRRRTRKFQTPG